MSDDMTAAQRADFALDCAMKAAVSATFDELTAKETRALRLLSISEGTIVAFQKMRPYVAKAVLAQAVRAPFGSRYMPVEILEHIWPALSADDRQMVAAMHREEIKQRPKGWHFTRNAGA